MMKAVVKARDGHTMLILGLSAANMEHLLAERPCYLDLTTLHLAERIGHIAIFYGKDEAKLFDTLHELIGPDTEIVTQAPGPAAAGSPGPLGAIRTGALR